jgi:hypothetical protein
MAAEVDPGRRQMMAELAAWHDEWARKWGIDDHPYEGMTIEEWEARIPPEAQADYQRGADAIQAAWRGPAPASSTTYALAGEELPPPPRLGDDVPPPQPPAAPPPPLARTRDEALFYLQLQRCPRCGEQRTPWGSELVEVGGVLARRYFGDCAQCGQAREYVFRVPDRIPPRPPGASMHYGGDEPSELIDAGQWLLMSEPAAEQTRADLAAGELRDAALHAELALTCVTEVTKFVPPGSTEVPDSGFFTPAGRAARAADPRRFTLRRLLLLLDMLHEEFDPVLPAGTLAAGRAPASPAAEADRRPAWRPDDPRSDSAPPQPATPTEPSVPTERAVPAVPLGRTTAEIRLFLAMRPCDCGAVTDQWSSHLGQAGADLAAVYSATCPACGRQRDFSFRLPPEELGSGPEGASFRYGDATPSQLLDPGEWLLAADQLARSVPVLEPGASDQERARYRYALGRAAAALAEVARFAPPGAVQVPESAFVTDRGRAAYAAEPGRFRLDRLAAVRDAYLRLLEDAGLT